MKTIQLKLNNVKCGGCIITVIDTVNSTSGFSDPQLSLPNSILNVVCSDESLINELSNKLEIAGYPVDHLIN